MSTEFYSIAREKYLPKKVNLVFIAESPPFVELGVEPRYFYFDTLSKKDFLYRGMMQALFPKADVKDKPPFLREFQEKGFLLMDASELPVNQYSDKQRDRAILEGLPDLLSRLKSLPGSPSEIVLIKKNVFDLLYFPLISNSFEVLNKESIPFPACGNQKRFRTKLREALKQF